MTATASPQLLNAVYTSSADGANILSKLTKRAGFTAENVISRLAIGRSLAHPKVDWDPALTADSNGKQLRGVTLLGRQEIACALLAMMLEHEGERSDVDGLRRLVRLHWERGLRLIERDLGDRDFADLLVQYSEKSLLSVGASTHDAAVSPSRAFGTALVGQHRLKKQMRELIATAEASNPLRFRLPLYVVGDPGTGHTTVARALGSALQLPVAELNPPELPSPAAVLAELDRQLAIAGYSKTEVRSDHFRYPSCLIHVRGEPSPDVVAALQPRRAYSPFGGSHLCIPGGALVLSGPPASGTKGYVLPLSPYTREDIAEILRRETGSWPLEIRRLLAVAGRLNPALALKKAEEYFDIAKRLGAGHRPSESHLLGVMRDHWGVDGLGLLPADYECLGNLGPLTSTRTATGTTEFLERLGLVRRTANELVVTERGRAALEARSN